MATIKEKKLARELVKTYNGDQNLNGGQMLEKVGYSKNLAKHPNRVIQQDGVQEELNKLIPDDFLAEKHLALLNKQEVRIKNNVTTGEIDVIPTGEIDVIAVKAGLDMAYKLKGSYAPTKSESINLNLTKEITPQEEDIAKKANEDLKKLYGEKDIEN